MYYKVSLSNESWLKSTSNLLILQILNIIKRAKEKKSQGKKKKTTAKKEESSSSPDEKSPFHWSTRYQSNRDTPGRNVTNRNVWAWIMKSSFHLKQAHLITPCSRRNHTKDFLGLYKGRESTRTETLQTVLMLLLHHGARKYSHLLWFSVPPSWIRLGTPTPAEMLPTVHSACLESQTLHVQKSTAQSLNIFQCRIS